MSGAPGPRCQLSIARWADSWICCCRRRRRPCRRVHTEVESYIKTKSRRNRRGKRGWKRRPTGRGGRVKGPSAGLHVCAPIPSGGSATQRRVWIARLRVQRFAVIPRGQQTGAGRECCMSVEDNHGGGRPMRRPEDVEPRRRLSAREDAMSRDWSLAVMDVQSRGRFAMCRKALADIPAGGSRGHDWAGHQGKLGDKLKLGAHGASRRAS